MIVVPGIACGAMAPMLRFLHKRMDVACRKIGYATRRTRLSLKHFSQPMQEEAQLSLFQDQ